MTLAVDNPESATVFDGAQSAPLSGDRLHLNEGPMDLIIGVEGSKKSVREAFQRAETRFQGLLEGLVSELSILRQPVGAAPPVVTGSVAKRMVDAVMPHADSFVTPMAAVAGAVADEIRDAIANTGNLHKAYVNDGGDIALFLTSDTEMKVGLVPALRSSRLGGSTTISADLPMRGVATSGMGGRSFSFGIADAVTVLAPTTAAADAASTLIANEVDIDHPAIQRVPAMSLDPDSDLGDRLVTVERGPLPGALIDEALTNGLRYARWAISQGLINDAYLACAGQTRIARWNAIGFNEKPANLRKAPTAGAKRRTTGDRSDID